MHMKFLENRRGWCGFLLVLGLLGVAGSSFPAQLQPTPHTGEGPFFPPADTLGADADLTTAPGASGSPEGRLLEIEGTVREAGGQSVSGALIVIWQTDIHGKYDHPREQRITADGTPIAVDPNFQYSGQATTDAEGHYRFRTIVPGSYGRRPAHIHFRVTHPEHRTLASEMQFQGDPYAEADSVTSAEERSSLAIQLENLDGEGPARARFDIVLSR